MALTEIETGLSKRKQHPNHVCITLEMGGVGGWWVATLHLIIIVTYIIKMNRRD